MKDYRKLCAWFFMPSPSRALSHSFVGGCKFGYKGFQFLCKKCKNCCNGIYNEKI